MFGLTDDELATILTILRQNNIQKSILFGSRAMGNFKKGSDVDIAVIGDDRKLSYCLNEQSNLPYFFDVVNLEKINNQNLVEHIQRVGKRLDEAQKRALKIALKSLQSSDKVFLFGSRLPESIKDDLSATITYFSNNIKKDRMNYAQHVNETLPIGSSVTEAACKTLVKQRLCGSGMRWKNKGAKVVLCLRALVQTTDRWEKINQLGVEHQIA